MLAAYHTNNNPSEPACVSTNYWSSALNLLLSSESRHVIKQEISEILESLRPARFRILFLNLFAYSMGLRKKKKTYSTHLFVRKNGEKYLI